MELVHQIFVKLGARYVIITDAEGLCGSLQSFYGLRLIHDCLR